MATIDFNKNIKEANLAAFEIGKQMIKMSYYL